MPTYDYKCTNCGYLFEHFQKMSDETLTECPVCKGNLKRLIGSGAGMIFKGSGFYLTDYKNKKNVTNNNPEKTETSKETKKVIKESKTTEVKK